MGTSQSASASTSLEAPITAVAVRHLGLPTGLKSFVLPNGQHTPTELSVLLVRVTDRDGAVGQSLLWSQRPEQLPVYEAGARYLAPVLAHSGVATIDALLAAMHQAATFFGSEGACAFAASGLEMAVQDLTCRRRDIALSDLLGRRRERVRAYQTGLMLPGTPDELVDEAAAICERGIKAIKMIVGKPDIGEDVERIEAVRASLPSDVDLMVDALQRWTVPQALEAAERFASLGLVWLEDPLPHHEVGGYAELVRAGNVDVATGETCFTLASFEALLDAGVPYVIAELERTGGVTGWMRVAELVGERGAVMLPHIYPHVSAQLLATLPGPQLWWECVSWFDRLVDEPFEIVDGEVRVSRRPGSGFDPSPDAIERYATSPWILLT
jgi:L-alanine-DL-glutamate epimerase-like enolase superfamily enzyme